MRLLDLRLPAWCLIRAHIGLMAALMCIVVLTLGRVLIQAQTQTEPRKPAGEQQPDLSTAEY